MSKRIALMIGNNRYHDENLSQLKTPAADVQSLAAVLRHPAMGDFDRVETLINQSAPEICRHISQLFGWKKRHDTLLLYFSGQAILDETGQLYLAVVDTMLDALAATAIPAAYITECMDRSFSRQQILLLDCHYSGVVAQRSKVDTVPGQVQPQLFKGRGYGRVVLTATEVTSYILAGEQIFGNAEESLFTAYLIQGLRSGAADTDEDGHIEVRELYQYASAQMVRRSPAQKPRLWSYGQRDKFVIARNPNKVELAHAIKWDLIFGAIMAPLATIVIGAGASLSTSVGMAGLFLLLYALLYWVLD